jgi:hypothetical protein
LTEYCNPTGIEVTQSTNIRFYEGSNNIIGRHSLSSFPISHSLTFVTGCESDIVDAVGFLINNSTNILLSKVTSITEKSNFGAYGINAIASQYLGLYEGETRVNGYVTLHSPSSPYPSHSETGTGGTTVMYLQDTTYFTVDNTDLVGATITGESSYGIYLDGVSILGILNSVSYFSSLNLFCFSFD